MHANDVHKKNTGIDDGCCFLLASTYIPIDAAVVQGIPPDGYNVYEDNRVLAIT